MSILLNILIGLVSGVISGMGIGGGAILIPALIILDHIGQQLAQGINLLYFLPTAIAALIIHIKNKKVDIKTALILAASGVIGAAAGAMIANILSSELLRRMFGIFLALIGIYEIYKGIKMPSKNKI